MCTFVFFLLTILDIGKFFSHRNTQACVPFELTDKPLARSFLMALLASALFYHPFRYLQRTIPTVRVFDPKILYYILINGHMEQFNF
jgi:hypothetical protein